MKNEMKTQKGSSNTRRARSPATQHQRLSTLATTTLRAMGHISSKVSYPLVLSEASNHRPQMLLCARKAPPFFFGMGILQFEERTKRSREEINENSKRFLKHSSSERSCHTASASLALGNHHSQSNGAYSLGDFVPSRAE